MIYEGGLFFSSPDHLGDHHEGVLGDADRRQATEAAELEYPGVPSEKAFLRWVEERWAARLRAVTVSCWYLGGGESTTMWHGYGNSVSIESTVGSVFASLARKGVTAAEVRYQAYSERPATGLNPVSVLSYKRPPFASEHEVRFFCELDDDELAALNRLRALPFTRVSDFRPRGLLVYRDGVVAIADWSKIIHRVRLAPNAPRWLRYAVVHMADTAGFSNESIVGSELEGKPYVPPGSKNDW